MQSGLARDESAILFDYSAGGSALLLTEWSTEPSRPLTGRSARETGDLSGRYLATKCLYLREVVAAHTDVHCTAQHRPIGGLP
jgi:hypothetical protein